MKVSDDELFEQISSTLHRWASEVPADVPPIDALASRVPVMPAHRRSLVRWVAAAAACLAVLGAVGVWRIEARPGPAVRVGTEPPAMVRLSVGARWGVRAVATTADAVWVISSRDEELYRIDPSTNSVVQTFAIPSHVEGLVAHGGWLWLSRFEPNEILRVDPRTGVLTARIPLGSQPALAADADGMWAVADRDGAGWVYRIDETASTATPLVALDGRSGFALALDGTLWVGSTGGHTVTRVDLAGARVTAVVEVAGEPRPFTAAAGAVWVGVNRPDGGVVARIDPESATVTATVAVGRNVHSLATVGDQVWLTNRVDGTISVIDAKRSSLLATSPLGSMPGGLAAGNGSVWITPYRATEVWRLDAHARLEAYPDADVSRFVHVGAGTVYLRCSGAGAPTVLLEADAGSGAGSWSVVVARLGRTTRVCAYDRVGIAEPEELGSAGPASSVAADLRQALGMIGESGPYVIVGRGWGSLYAEMFAATGPADVTGLVLVDPVSAAWFDAVRLILPAEARAKFDEDLLTAPELRDVERSAAEVERLGGLGLVPLVVVAGRPESPEAATAGSDPPLAVSDVESLVKLSRDTAVDVAGRSQRGRPLLLDRPVTDDDIVEAVRTIVAEGG